MSTEKNTGPTKPSNSNRPVTDARKPPSGLTMVMLRNNFYRDGYRSSSATSVLLAIGLIFSVLGNIYQGTRDRPAPVYFATSPSGILTPMVALSDPILNPTQLANWVQEAVASSFTLDAKNYVQQIQKNSVFYTPDGFQEYKNALSSSNQLQLIKEKVMITSAIPDGVPAVIGTARTRDGTLMWKMQMPLTVEYTSAKEHYVQKLMVTMVIIRRPTTETPSGVGITQLTARSA